VGLNRTNLEAAGLDATTANLADPRCNAHEERGGMVWYQVERTEGACGNTLEVRRDPFTPFLTETFNREHLL
jgi:hypothetical protein